MGEINPFTAIGAAVVELLTRHSTIFVTTGLVMFRGFAIVVFAWFGIKAALASAEGAGGVPLVNLASLVLLIAFGHTMLTYYASPIPGFGRSFTQLITDQSAWLAAQIETSGAGIERPTQRDLPTPGEAALLRRSARHRVSDGLARRDSGAGRANCRDRVRLGAIGVAVLVGPIFIPFLIVPTLEWIFWGWLRALLQYAFYQVIAQAFVFVLGTFLLRMLEAFPPPYTVDRLLVGGFHVVFLLMAFTYGLLKVPTLTNSLFAGRSGEVALPRSLS